MDEKPFDTSRLVTVTQIKKGIVNADHFLDRATFIKDWHRWKATRKELQIKLMLLE